MLDTNLSATIKLTRQFLKMMLEASLARSLTVSAMGQTHGLFVSSFLGVITCNPDFKALKLTFFQVLGSKGGRCAV